MTTLRNISPPLQWADLPEGTRSLVLIVDDPDAPDPAHPKTTWVHWVVYNIPPSLGGGGGRAFGRCPNRQRWERTVGTVKSMADPVHRLAATATSSSYMPLMDCFKDWFQVPRIKSRPQCVATSWVRPRSSAPIERCTGDEGSTVALVEFNLELQLERNVQERDVGVPTVLAIPPPEA